MNEKEERLLTAIESLTEFVRRIEAKVTAEAPFYLGAEDAEIPDWELRLECLLDPRMSGAEVLLRDFSQALKDFERDGYPRGVFEELHQAVQKLLRKVNELYPSQEFFQAMLHVSDFRNYLEGSRALAATMHHTDSIEYGMRLLQDRLANMALLLHNWSDKLIHERIRIKVTVSGIRCRRGGPKRKYSPRQEHEIIDFVQRPDFDTGRERNGRTCYNITAAARAWTKLKHPTGMPQTEKEFRAAYESLRKRR